MGPIPPGMFPKVLALPTWLLRVVARAQLKIDPEARSSMWQDLANGRATEVDFLNGEIVALAEEVGAQAPLNRRIVELVHEVERAGRGSPALSPDALGRALGL
jgi:2-dehydropantoate 2-reductase